MSEQDDANTVLMTAPVPQGVAEKFKEIAKAHGTPIRVLGGMLYENFIEEHEAGKVFVVPTKIEKQEEAPAATPKRKPAAK